MTRSAELQESQPEVAIQLHTAMALTADYPVSPGRRQVCRIVQPMAILQTHPFSAP